MIALPTIPDGDANSAEVKRKVSSEVLKEVGPLMKQYQEEVDKLSNRWAETHACVAYTAAIHSVPHCITW